MTDKEKNQVKQDEQKQQELMFKFQMFEQQIQGLQQQMQAVEGAVAEMESLNLGLDELKGKKDEEIMASIGKGIFARAKLLSEDLIVDVGGRNLVKKSIPETQDIIKKQVEKLKDVQKELEKAMQEINEDLTKTMLEHQNNQNIS
jgi:prefoldin alpha subunit